MEFNKPVSNPMMVGSIELLKAEDTPEHRQMFLEELQKAKFLAPVVIDPAPQPDEKGQVRIPRDAKVQFPMLSTEDGRKFFMAFTDWMELKKWKDEENQQTFAMNFDDYRECCCARMHRAIAVRPWDLSSIPSVAISWLPERW